MQKLFAAGAAVALTGVLAASAQALPHSNATGLSHRNACAVPAQDSATCFSKVVTDSNGKTFSGSPDATSGPAGYHSADLQSAYNLTPGTTAGTGPTIAIVDAYDAPKAAADLAVYRSTMNLPLCSDGTVSCILTKINQSGGSTAPPADAGWAEEISLDLDMASSACPQCKILLVEATSNSFTNLMTAVRTAKAWTGVVAVSNSYGAPEFNGESSYDSNFVPPTGKTIAFTVSSGDNGYGTEYPAASPNVTATGGTSLSSASGTQRGWSETAWSGAGSGCSTYEPAKPTWQTDSGCSRRTIADVSSVSNPNTGVSVYDTYSDPGWMVFGGTSAAAPFIAGVYAQNMKSGAPASWPYAYANTTALNDVTSGSNGRCTRGKSLNGAYLCTAGPGYDGPTGLGTPNGTTAF